MSGRKLLLLGMAAGTALLGACAGGGVDEIEASAERRSIVQAPYGMTPEGEAVEIFTLTNASGMRVRFTNYGGIIVSVEVPDRDGNVDDVTLGFDSLDPYLEEHPYFGAVIGRFGNRIAQGRFTLDGQEYSLATNNGPNHLHGGVRGFDRVVWQAEPFEDETGVGAVLTYASPDGEEGYPGTLTVRVVYTLTNADELVFDYHATTDKATPVNLTNHAYWNLDGHASGDVLGQRLTLTASYFTPVDATLIPTGEIRSVRGTPMDFTSPTPIGTRIEQADEQLAHGGGYDHNWVLDRDGDGLSHAATLHSPRTGRVMEVYTTEPGVQFYAGNFLDGTLVGKGGHAYGHRNGLCLETQHFPDSPNQPAFPSTILRPGEAYTSRTLHRFSLDTR
jgi:aldose 1-epimerase